MWFWVVAGEQDLEIFGVHVEPSVLGHGSSRRDGHRARQRRGARLASTVIISALFLVLFRLLTSSPLFCDFLPHTGEASGLAGLRWNHNLARD